MEVCPIAPPKGFPNVYGAVWRIALLETFEQNPSFFENL